MNTPYASLKSHFNKLLIGGYQSSNGLEPVRDVYADAFERKINLFDIYQTEIDDKNNAINSICTLLGPEPDDDDEIPTGIVWENRGNRLCAVNVFSNDILKGINTDEMAKWYIGHVYESMLDVVQQDFFYKPDKIARKNPYMTFVKFVPLYFTFHHVAECIPEMYKREIFRDLIDKYTYAGDTADLIISSLENTEYTTDISGIYNTVTAGRKAKILG